MTPSLEEVSVLKLGTNLRHSVFFATMIFSYIFEQRLG